jgi:hypothetical protein
MPNINFDQPSEGKVSSNSAALSVRNSGTGAALAGQSSGTNGVEAIFEPPARPWLAPSNASRPPHNGLYALSIAKDGSGVFGENPGDQDDHSGIGVRGSSTAGTGVDGHSTQWRGVYGHSEHNAGVAGESRNFDGVWGETHSKRNAAGVSGRSYGGRRVYGVWGGSNDETSVEIIPKERGFPTFGFLGGVDPNYNEHAGVYGESNQQGVNGHATTETGTGVYGDAVGNGFGIRGESEKGTAVSGESYGSDDNAIGVHGDGVVGVYGTGSRLAAKFEGNVEISGIVNMKGINSDIILTNQDCAEDFDTSADHEIEPGSVMVIDNEGRLKPCSWAYDKRVAGVVSGAGDLRPGIILGRAQVEPDRLPIALLGKVYCKVDASESPIKVGDLLTTSPITGHAMKACDPVSAFGSVIGKALSDFRIGRGLIPILVALQ